MENYFLQTNMKIIDNLLNAITMYRLVLYGLLAIGVVALGLAAAGMLAYSVWSLAVSLAVVLAGCVFSNWLIAAVLKIPTNTESVYISALILWLIFPPATTVVGVGVLAVAGLVAMASKYVLAWQGRHIFNPAALAAFALGFWPISSASWWVGSAVLLPVVLIVGALIVHKIRRWHMVLAFVAAASATILAFGVQAGFDAQMILPVLFTSWPIIFFGTVMLTEPATAPNRVKWRMVYGIVVGAMFGAQFSWGPIYPTPELALLVGNLLAFVTSFSPRIRLTLQAVREVASNIYHFDFVSSRNIDFSPGQYLEWTLAHAGCDMRGNRRYFTIASAPGEATIQLGVRMQPERGSSFKRALLAMKPGDAVWAGQLNGEFVLPVDPKQKLLWIAGGIGVTPFRSMAQQLIGQQDTHDVVLIYTAAAPQDFVYVDVFDKAASVGVRSELVVTNTEVDPAVWSGRVGRLDREALAEMVPDLGERMVYISGPDAMVRAYRALLRASGVPARQIKTDYFPGF